MAEKMPLSLNQRNERLLQDLGRNPHSSAIGASSHSTIARKDRSDMPEPEEKLNKVKLEGRRRLCKFSSYKPGEQVEFQDGQGTPDFSSTANTIVSSSNDRSDIRDILNDLTSRLDYLSMETTKVTEMVEVSESTSCFPKHVAMSEQLDKKEDAASRFDGSSAEYMSADSSMPYVCLLSDTDLEDSADSFKAPRHNVAVNKRATELRINQENVNIQIEAENVNDNSFSKASSFVNQFNSSQSLHQSDNVSFAISSHSRMTCPASDKNSDDDSIEVLDYSDGHSVRKDMDCISLSSKLQTYTLPGNVAKLLYSHQRDGLKWLWALHCRSSGGGILGDDMGLGKTMQVSAFLAGLFSSCLIKRAMIVAPKTLLPHWIKELSAVGLSEKIRDYFGASGSSRQYELQYVLQDGGVLLTTYDIVRNNYKSLRGVYSFPEAESEDSITWDYIILDEGHIIKNPSTQRAKSLLEIPSAHRLIISGTPIQNNLKELWALFNFCCPEILGDKKEFKDRYEYAILRGNEKNASDREKRIGSTVAKELRERIKPFFLRRLKSEVFPEGQSTKSVSLPKKNEIIVWLRLSQCQRQLYEAFLKSEMVHSSLDGSALSALTVLKKICDHPFLLTKRAAESVLEGVENMPHQIDLHLAEEMAFNLANMIHQDDAQVLDNVSCKISFILSLLENLVNEGHNILIFSQSRKMLDIIQEVILLKGYMFLRIDGTTKASEREKIVNDFQAGNVASIFLLTSQVGGLGLTLTRADRVIVVDPAWNPSVDNQSVDRAYRIGQDKDVVVYRLMTCGTIEEKIYKMQVFKGGLFKTATEQKEQTRYFSQKDLRELFSLPEHGFDVSLTQKQLYEEHDSQHTMDDSLKGHIKFLDSQGIAGVSHHNLLFSKTTPLPFVEEEGIVLRKGIVSTESSSSSNCSLENNTCDGGKYAFKPKDVRPSNSKFDGGSGSGNADAATREMHIKETLNRLLQTLANKALVSKLPDKGENIKKKIDNLNLQLDQIHKTSCYNLDDSIKPYSSTRPEVIDVDDISLDLRKLSVQPDI